MEHMAGTRVSLTNPGCLLGALIPSSGLALCFHLCPFCPCAGRRPKPWKLRTCLVNFAAHPPGTHSTLVARRLVPAECPEKLSPGDLLVGGAALSLKFSLPRTPLPLLHRTEKWGTLPSSHHFETDGKTRQEKG